MLGQDFRETPNFVKGVIERRGGGPDDVRFAEIAFHAGGLEFLEEFFWMFVRQDRQLAPARIRSVRRDDREFFRGVSRPGTYLVQ